jgi:hypothetical protein
MFTKLNPFAFFIAFAIGMFFIYVITPAPEVVVKFPTPWNAGKIIYKDDNDTCFVYKASKTSCPLDVTLIQPQPMNENLLSQ